MNTRLISAFLTTLTTVAVTICGGVAAMETQTNINSIPELLRGTSATLGIDETFDLMMSSNQEHTPSVTDRELERMRQEKLIYDSLPKPVIPPSPTSNPAYHLNTARFTMHQPRVLGQIGAHHAYARGLTGSGVRIGIEDTIVDYTQTEEFGNRVKLRDSDGAVLSYMHPFGDEPFSDVSACRYNHACRYWRGNSQGDIEEYNSWVRDIVNQDGWPRLDDSAFFVDEHFSQYNDFERLFRWREVPTPYGIKGSHGTVVASVAAGKSLGVAPEATIIPIARNLTDDQNADSRAERLLRSWIQVLPIGDRRTIDNLLADAFRNHYSKFDIINRSFGIPVSEFAVIDTVASARWYHQYLPRTLNALWQTDRPDAEKTILVYAAGNSSERIPGLGALLPYGFAELRGHSIAVAATNPQTGDIAGYSNRCGPLPPNWNAARHGPHYCLAAPGTVRGLVPNPNSPGKGDMRGGLSGTSVAAPLVSGALALLMEHFRGTRGNTEIVKRMLDTADRSGRYSDLETYGAGHLDIRTALSPVGTLNAGQSARPLSRTVLQTPAAFGSIAQRAVDIELAAFDEQDFPFWVPLSALVSHQADHRSPIPSVTTEVRTETPATGLDALGIYWADAGSRPQPEEEKWVLGLGLTSVSLARLPHDGAWGYGLSFESAGYLGTHTSGAFGSSPRSSMIWTSRAFERDLGDGWALNAEGTLAMSLPQYESDAIFSASTSVMTAMSMRIGTASTGLTVEQPLRAESGTGMFRVENGRIENGRKLSDEYRVPLRPGAREVRMTVRHERDALEGDFVVEVGHSINTGHVPGNAETVVGAAYRVRW